MFDLTLLDHLRLTFGHVVYRHQVHSQMAHARAQRSRWLRGAEAVLITAAAFTALGAAVSKVQGYSVASAVLAGLALAALLVHLTFDLDASADAHRASATRLWQIREQYQALLSDLCDGAVDVEHARHRRDALMNELHGIYENAPPTDHHAYKSAAQAVLAAENAALSDEEIDFFLPKPLQKAGKSSTA